MIDDVLVYLRNHLNEHLRAQSDWVPGESESEHEKVVFVDGDKMDPIAFKLGAVSVLLINLEEENTLRAPDAYAQTAPLGGSMKVKPEIRINLYVLFVARFKEYERGLGYLSRIIQHFQSHPVFDHHNAPNLSERIEKLIVELVTLPFSEQNEVWNALRVTYHPSVLYRVKMIVFRDQLPQRAEEITEKAMEIDYKD